MNYNEIVSVYLKIYNIFSPSTKKGFSCCCNVNATTNTIELLVDCIDEDLIRNKSDIEIVLHFLEVLTHLLTHDEKVKLCYVKMGKYQHYKFQSEFNFYCRFNEEKELMTIYSHKKYHKP